MKHEFRMNGSVKLELTATSALEEQLLAELTSYPDVELTVEAGKVILKKKNKPVEHALDTNTGNSGSSDSSTSDSR